MRKIVGSGLTFAQSNPESDVKATFSVNPQTIEVVRFFMTGDLAFYAAALGKENMSGSWCWLCTLSKKEWGTAQHAHGKDWTFEKMADIIAKTEMGDLPNTPANRKGCTSKPLFDAIPIQNYVCPVLHIGIGIGNKILSSTLDWVDKRVEPISEEEEKARGEFYEGEIDKDILINQFSTWTDTMGVDLATKQEEYSNLQAWRAERDEMTQKFVRTVIERKEIDATMKQWKGEIKLLEESRDFEKLMISNHKKLQWQRKAHLESLRRKRGKLSSPVCQQIEAILRIHGIERASHHGGELNGMAIRSLMTKANLIFSDIRNCLHAVEQSELRCPDS